MKQTLKKSVSILLSLIMVFSLFTIVPLTASAVSSSIPYYIVTVYYHVVDTSGDSSNYFDLAYYYPSVYDSDEGKYTSTVSSRVSCSGAAEQSGDRKAVFMVQGVPHSLDYNIYGKTADPSEWYVYKVTAKAESPVSGCGIGEITLWEGKFGKKISHVGGAGSRNTLYFSTPPSFEGWDNDNGTNATSDTYSYYSNVGIRAKGATSPSCDSPINVPAFFYTDSSVRQGVVYDQYGGRYPDQRASIYEKKSETGINLNGSTITVYFYANRANDYTYTFGYNYDAGVKSEKTVTIKTFDYIVNFYDKDRETLLKQETVDYGKSATPPDIDISPNDGKYKFVFSGWTGDDYTNIKDSFQFINVYADYELYPAFMGSGTLSDPYLIQNADDWESLRQRCMNYDTTDEYFRLENDITVSTPIGASDHRFKGIFDGNSKTLTFNDTATGENAAPFAFVDGCTIKNLHTAGTVNTAYKYAAGLVADLSGTVVIENCRSSVTINSTVNGDGTHGGFIAKANNGSNLTMRGCLFDGSFSGQSTNSCGGFIGWKNGTANIYDSIFAPSNISIGLNGCSTFARNKITTHNSYYLQTMGTDNLDMWKKGYTVTAGADVTINKGNGTLYNVSGITAYGTGLDYNDHFYAGTGDALSLSHSDKAGYVFKNYSVNTGSVSGNTLTVGSADTTVNAVYNKAYTVTWKNGDTVLETSTVESGEVPSYSGETPVKASDDKYSYSFKGWNPSVSSVTGDVTYTATYTKTPNPNHYSQDGDTYTIHDAAGWDVFCDLLADNDNGYFTGKTVNLANDISVNRQAGVSNHDFTGTFDGNGKTLTFNYTGSEDYIAPFYATGNGTSPYFRNLTVNGTINSTGKYAAGLIGHLYGNVTIENCKSNIDITAAENSGGFVGLCEHTVNFTNCLSSTVIHSEGTCNSGFVGWSRASGYEIHFTGCLFNGKLLQKNDSGGSNGGFIGWTGSNKTVTINNSICAPAALSSGETMASDNSATFARGWNETTTAANSYYITAFGTAQAKAAHSVTAGDNVTISSYGTVTNTYNVSGITAYSTGLYYGGTFYAGNGDSVSLTLDHDTPNDIPDGYGFAGYKVTAGTLEGTENPYTLTMPDSNVTVTAEFELITSWTSGDCTVTYDPETHTLTVTGSGAMANLNPYEANSSPWASYNDSVTSVVISDGVTGIGGYAFEGFSALTNLSIANTVTSIGEAAFHDCGSLEDITIPASVTSIGRFAFNSISQDATVTFVRPVSQSTLTIGNWAFNDDAALYYSGDSKYALFDETGEIESNASGDKLNGKTLTWKLPVYAVKVASANGTVTASVNGAAINEACGNNTVLLTVTPDEGYRFKSITATVQKERAEDLSDLVAMMGDAVFEGNSGFPGCTCKAEGGNFVVYDGETIVAELSESDIRNYETYYFGNPDHYQLRAICDDAVWYFEINNGKIKMVAATNASSDFIFYSKSGSQSTGNLNAVALTTVEEGARYSFTMPDREVTVTAEFTYADGVGASVIGHSVSLDGDIGVNFYMALDPEIAQSETAYMQFTIPNGSKSETKTVFVKDAREDGGYYIFKCSVAAKDMNAVITAQILGVDEEATVYTYSVKEYADWLIEHKNDSAAYTKAAPLVEKMLRYGAYAKEYFDKTNTLPDLGDVNIDSKFATYTSTISDDLFDGATLSLKSQTTLSLYFNSGVEGLTFTCIEEPVEGQPAKEMTVDTVRTDSGYIARIRDIAASELKNNFTLTVKNGETVLGTITYSPMNYCYKALNGGTTDERLINAVKALVAYADAAKVYFG